MRLLVCELFSPFTVYVNVTFVPNGWAQGQLQQFTRLWCSRKKKPLAGLRHSCMSSELRNYPSKWQHITLPADYNNTVNYCWSSIKLGVKDDCFFGTSFWNTSVLSLETIYCSSKRAGCCFCLSTWVVQRMSSLKCKKLKELCSILPLTTETPSTNLAPAQRRGWKIGS